MRNKKARALRRLISIIAVNATKKENFPTDNPAFNLSRRVKSHIILTTGKRSKVKPKLSRKEKRKLPGSPTPKTKYKEVILED